MKRAIIINGEFKGIKGLVTENNICGNAIFYPDNRNPYHLLVKVENVEYEVVENE